MALAQHYRSRCNPLTESFVRAIEDIVEVPGDLLI